jgi:SAM-dependent methyltransferase
MNRHRWAVETLAVMPDERLLEVGCGHGVAVSLICEQLTSGTITAIDRSPAMIERAAERNREQVDSGKAVFHAAALDRADFGDERFDKVFAFNVSLFWKHPAHALAAVRKLLTPTGTLYLFHQPPAWKEPPDRFAARLSEILRADGFAVADVVVQELDPAAAVGVVSHPVLEIRPARPDEGPLLSRLALHAKAHWGYDEQFLEAAREALTIDAETIAAARIFVLERKGTAIGFYGLAGDPPEGVLEWLFVEPHSIGRGYGRMLWVDVLARARAAGFAELLIESDRFAEPFYLAMGAIKVGATPSPVDGAPLPLLKISV